MNQQFQRLVNQAMDASVVADEYADPQTVEPADRRVERMDELTDAKIAASEARAETKMARIDGRLDTLIVQIGALGTQMSEMRNDNARTRDTVRNMSIGLFFGLAGLIVAIAFGVPAVYGLGTSTRDIIQSEVQKAQPTKPVTQ